MSAGFLATIGIHGAVILAVLLAPQRPRRLAIGVYFLTLVINEVPLLLLALFAATTLPEFFEPGALATGVGWLKLGLALALAGGWLVLLRNITLARPALETALGEPIQTGSRWLARLLPIPWWPRGVRRAGPLRYGPDERHRLDVYRRHDLAGPAPVLVYLHGGGYFSGGRRREGRLLRHRFAQRGWVVVSADYRLRPRADWPDHLVDVKRLLAWIREHAGEHGIDPSTVVVSGSSAGGHLSVLCALTPNDPQLQPGFEAADTSVSGVVGLYGYYGRYYGRGPDESPVSDPTALPSDHAPPVLLVHGTHDTYTDVEGARAMAAHLRETSPSAVVYAELPGAQHGFDVLASERCQAVVAAAERFLEREVLDRVSGSARAR